MQKWANRKGFTIVELLIVVVVIAILAAITIVAYNGIQSRARISAVQSSASQASKKIAAYAITNNDTLPTDLAALGITDANGTTYRYTYDTTPSPGIYCVSALSNAVSYATTNSASNIEGRCVNNRVLNPSFETNTTSWTQAGTGVTTLTRVTSQAFAGSASLQAASSGTNAQQGAFTGGRASVLPNTTYTASVWVKGVVGRSVRIELGEWSATPALIGARAFSADVVLDGTWQRLTVNKTMGANALTADIIVRNVAAVAHTFYIDGVLLSEGTDQYVFGDGNSTGWSWSGTANNSTSLGPVLLLP